MDCNFPELLAGDLGRSEDVFRARNLTAGAPIVSAAGDETGRRLSPQDNSLGVPSSQPRDILSRMKSLQMVSRESYSEVMAHLHVEPRNSIESTSSGSSGGMEPPSIAGREVSVFTAATSVTSGRFSPSDKSNSPTDKISVSNHSWVDLAMGDNKGNKNKNNQHHNNPHISPPYLETCRSLGNIDPPPIPPRARPAISNDSRSMSLGYRKARGAATQPFSAFSSPGKVLNAATQPPAPHVLEGVRIKQPTEFPTRRSSLIASTDLLSLPTRRISTRSPPSLRQFIPSDVPRLQPNATPTRRPSSPGRVSVYQEDEEARSMLSLTDEEDERDEEEEDRMMDLAVTTPKSKQEIATPAILSPMADLDQWMEESSISLSHLPQPTKDYQGSRIHIAPEVLDTLRISVACFPETMLLCSSLSIETLRGHSKKIRYRTPNGYGTSQMSLNLPDDTAKSFKWKWLTTKRMPEPSPTKLQVRKGHMELSAAAIDPQSQDIDWQAVKNIFPKGTDHLCDALYAHIVAYNYISVLCPRSAVVSQVVRPSTQQSSQPSISDTSSVRSSSHFDGNKIPFKAASLLGLQNDSAATIAPPRDIPSLSKPRPLRGKASFIKKRENAKSFGPSASRSPDDHDQSLRDLRLGLAKCITRLVGTLRLTSNDSSTSLAKPTDMKDIDPLFIRALCEVVRCNEER